MSGDPQKYVAAAMPPADFKRVQEQMQGCDGPGPTAPYPGKAAHSPIPRVAIRARSTHLSLRT